MCDRGSVQAQTLLASIVIARCNVFKKKRHNTGWVFVVSSWSHHTTTQRRRQLSCPGPKKGRPTRARKHCPSVATKTRLKIIQNTMQNTHTHTLMVCVCGYGEVIRYGKVSVSVRKILTRTRNPTSPPTRKLALIRAIVFPFRQRCEGEGALFSLDCRSGHR